MSRLSTQLPMLLGFWRIPYSASTWRWFAYVLVALPLAILSLPLAATGPAQVAARYQRRLARALVGTPAQEPPRRPTDPTVVALAAAAMLVGVACWLLLWRFTSAVLVVPQVVNFLALALVGRAPAVARVRQRLAGRGAGLAAAADRPARGRPRAGQPAGRLRGLDATELPGLLHPGRPGLPGRRALPRPRPRSHLRRSTAAVGPVVGHPPRRLPRQLLGQHLLHRNGGPTLAGTWAYHTAQQWVTIFPLLAWAIRGVTRLQGWLTQALLGSPQPARQ
jgi:hypothetical protein